MSKDVSVAEGAIAKLIGLLLGAAALIAGATYLEVFAGGYSIKTGANSLCNDMARVSSVGEPAPEDRKKLDRRMAGEGAKVKHPDDVYIELERQGSGFVCHVDIDYDTVTPWKLVDLLWPAAPPLNLHHVIKFDKLIGNTG